VYSARSHCCCRATHDAVFKLHLIVGNPALVSGGCCAAVRALAYVSQPHILLSCIPCMAAALMSASMHDDVPATVPPSAAVAGMGSPMLNSSPALKGSRTSERQMMRLVRSLSIRAGKPEESERRDWQLQTLLASLFRLVHVRAVVCHVVSSRLESSRVVSCRLVSSPRLAFGRDGVCGVWCCSWQRASCCSRLVTMATARMLLFRCVLVVSHVCCTRARS
jgi:hypothetical protein